MDEISSAIEAVKHELPNIEFKLDEPLKNYTTFIIGGPVRFMLFPEDMNSLTKICNIISEFGITPFVLGNGSNVLASDERHDLTVINTSKLDSVELTGETEITAEAGARLSNLTVFAYEHGLSGFEFAHGIPGTLGGAVVMNAGAYGGEMKDVVFCTTAYNIKTGKYALTAPDHEYSYRHSRFSNTDDIVLSTVIRLGKGDKESIKRRMDDLSARRRESQPLDMPSGGSTFKRPNEGYAAALIEQAGLKGHRIGGAQVSEKHAGFIINRGGATFSDVMAVVDHVRETILRLYGVELELEIRLITNNK